MADINLKIIKSLKTKKGRDEHGLFIIEGEKTATEIPPDWHIRTYICTNNFAGTAQTYLNQAPVVTVSESRFASLSDTVTPQGIMAVCEKRAFTLDQLLNRRTEYETPFFLIGENLSDPGNIGTLIRTAAAAGANGCILSEGSGDIYNPKVIRAAAGAILRIPIVEKADLAKVIPMLKSRGIIILAAHLQGTTLPYDVDLRQGCGFVIGNEARGLTEEVSQLADIRIKLFMSPDIESLNASVAGGILLYEVVRQRIKPYC